LRDAVRGYARTREVTRAQERLRAHKRDAVRGYARTREVTRAQERGAPLLDASKYTCDKKRRGEM